MALTSPTYATAAVAQDRPLRRLRFAAMGTTCEVQYASDNLDAARSFEAAAQGWVERFESRCTRFRDDSVIGRINCSAGTGEWIEVDPDMERIFDVCGSICGMTHGLLDASAAPLARLWNYKSASPRIPTAAEIAAALRCVGWQRVERRPGGIRLPERGMALDLGGWGKEYAVDAVARLAREHGLDSVLVDFGHDINASGAPPGRPAWHVGLEDPARPGTRSGSIALVHRAVASSGDYLRCFIHGGRRYGHIIDPRTGRPVANGCRQVTVVGTTCLMAGVLSTTAFILGPSEGLRWIQDTMGAEGRIVADGAIYQTRGFFQYVVT